MQARWLSLALIFGLVSMLMGCATTASEAGKAAAAPAPGASYEYSEQASTEQDMDSDGTLDAEDAPFALRSRAPRVNVLGAPPPPAEPTAGEGEAASNEQPSEQVASEQRAPLLIYQATLTMSVFETKKHIDEVEAIAKKKGGYLLTRSDQTITIRVPAEKFTETLEEVAKSGDELHREVSARDVTDQYNDLAIRLKNAEAMRERLVALLARATSVKDALAVEEQLERIALDIEQIKGKLKRLRELIAFSTITVRFEARPVDQVESTVHLPFPWLSDLGLVRLLDL